jgi:hypothetical protein
MQPRLAVLLAPRDVVEDGRFDGAGWSAASNWSVGSGVATCAGNGAANNIVRPANVVAGVDYLVEFDILTVSVAGGGVSAVVGGAAPGAIYTTVGKKSERVTAAATAATVGLGARGNGLFAGTLDNLRIKRVS